MEIANFAEIEAEFIERVHHIVWCTAATVDRQGRPRSRILHPIWEGPTGWVGTHRHSFKSKHLAQNPYISLTYVENAMSPIHVDCRTAWIDDPEQKQRIWDLFKHAPEPLGFDPADTFGSVHDDDFGLLKLTPWRIALINFPAESHETGQRIWRPAAGVV